jgi:hypothetical protein
MARVGKEMPIPYLSPQVSERFILERVKAAIRVVLRRAFPTIRATDTTGTVFVPAPAPAETHSAPPDAAFA